MNRHGISRNGGPRGLVRAEPSWCRRHSRRDLGPPQAADVSRHEGPLRDKVKAVSYRETQERHWPEQEEQTDRRGNTKLNKRGRRPRLHRVVGQIQAVAEHPEGRGGGGIQRALRANPVPCRWPRRRGMQRVEPHEGVGDRQAVREEEAQRQGERDEPPGRVRQPAAIGRRYAEGEQPGVPGAHMGRNGVVDERNWGKPLGRNRSADPRTHAPPARQPKDRREQKVNLPLRGDAPHRGVDPIAPSVAEVVDQQAVGGERLRLECRRRAMLPQRGSSVRPSAGTSQIREGGGQGQRSREAGCGGRGGGRTPRTRPAWGPQPRG